MSTQIVVKNRIGAEAEIGRRVLEALLGKSLQEAYPADPIIEGTTSYGTKHLEVLFLGVGEVKFALGKQSDGSWKGGLTAETFHPKELHLGLIHTDGDEIIITMENKKVDL